MPPSSGALFCSAAENTGWRGRTAQHSSKPRLWSGALGASVPRQDGHTYQAWVLDCGRRIWLGWPPLARAMVRCPAGRPRWRTSVCHRWNAPAPRRQTTLPLLTKSLTRQPKSLVQHTLGLTLQALGLAQHTLSFARQAFGVAQRTLRLACQASRLAQHTPMLGRQAFGPDQRTVELARHAFCLRRHLSCEKSHISVDDVAAALVRATLHAPVGPGRHHQEHD